MATAQRFLPLLARSVIVAGSLGLCAIAILYPERRAEADLLAAVPACPAGITDSSTCRVMAEATLVRIECPRPGWNLQACALELSLSGRRLFLSLPQESVPPLARGEPLRIELFRGLPTGAFVNGGMVARAGAPEEAMATMRATAIGSAVAIAVAAAFLASRR